MHIPLYAFLTLYVRRSRSSSVYATPVQTLSALSFWCSRSHSLWGLHFTIREEIRRKTHCVHTCEDTRTHTHTHTHTNTHTHTHTHTTLLYGAALCFSVLHCSALCLVCVYVLRAVCVCVCILAPPRLHGETGRT